MKTYIQEKDLLPAHYTPVKEPFFSGRGNHSVSQLEDLCEQFQELVHQMRVREKTITQKADIEIINGPMPSCESIGRKHIIGNDNKCAECDFQL